MALPIPNKPRELVSMDFITSFSDVYDYEAILTTRGLDFSKDGPLYPLQFND